LFTQPSESVPRFARIKHIDLHVEKAHIQWLEHGSQIFMEELAHDQELFYNNTCTDVDFEAIVSKITAYEVRQGYPKPVVGLGEFFVK
jgi:DNA (cytosine-5)-methyltransferase 1